MSRFGIASLLILISLAAPVGAEEGNAGSQIDQMMNKEIMADTLSAAITAESALPQKHDDNLDDAVKLAVAKIPESKTESAVKIEEKVSSPLTVADESKQPLFTETPAGPKIKKAPADNMWLRMGGSLLVVLILIGGGFYGFQRWPGSKKLSARNRMIEVLSQHHLGPKRSIAVVRVAGEACLIGITDNNISILKTLSLLDEDVPKETSGNNKSETMSAKFQKTLAAKFTKSPEAVQSGVPAGAPKGEFYTRTAKTTAPTAEPPSGSEDDFAMRGLREIVGTKLKTMREL